MNAEEYLEGIPIPKKETTMPNLGSNNRYTLIPVNGLLYWIIIDNNKLIGIVSDFKKRFFIKKESDYKIINSWIDFSELDSGVYILEIILNKNRMLITDILKDPEIDCLNLTYRERLEKLKCLKLKEHDISQKRLKILTSDYRSLEDAESIKSKIIARDLNKTGLYLSNVEFPFAEKMTVAVVGVANMQDKIKINEKILEADTLDKIPITLREQLVKKHNLQIKNIDPEKEDKRKTLFDILSNLIKKEKDNQFSITREVILVAKKTNMNSLEIFGYTSNKQLFQDISDCDTTIKKPIEINDVNKNNIENIKYLKNFYIVEIKKLQKNNNSKLLNVQILSMVAKYDMAKTLSILNEEIEISKTSQKLHKLPTEEIANELSDRLIEEAFINTDNYTAQHAYNSLQRYIQSTKRKIWFDAECSENKKIRDA